MEENRKEKFKSLSNKLSRNLLKSIKSMGFMHMTNIQAEVLPKALDGDDVVATAKTGSGKTLAFLIPVVETVYKALEYNIYETTCIIISPTRELATQTYLVLKQLLTHSKSITSTLIIGGESRKKQSFEITKGAQIVVSTPGRLFDHMRTKEFNYKQVKCLVLDECDKIFQYGFEEDLKQIINRLPRDRQTMLFSATESDRTKALIESAMKGDVKIINTSEDNVQATVEGLKQGYVLCEMEYRMWWLHKVLKKTQNFKSMVFFSSCKSVEFHHEFFNKYCQIPVMCIHGKMHQTDRTATINNFYEADKVALFCTDVAARGLDIPAVDWIIQYDPPGDTNEYIHRVGRTARGVGAAGNAVLLLRPEEKEFINHLENAKIFLNKYELYEKLYNLKPKLDEAMKNPDFHKLAIEAFEGYIRALEVRKLKCVFNLLTMDMDAAAQSFGLREKPDVDVRIGFSKKHRARKRKAAEVSSNS